MAGASKEKPPPTDVKPVTSPAEKLYQRALEIRDSAYPTSKELKRAVEMLYAAAGIEQLSIEKRPKANASEVAGDADGFLTADDVQIRWLNETVHHVGAVRELIYIFREGKAFCLISIKPACIT